MCMLLFQHETADRSNSAAAHHLYENVFLKSNLDFRSVINCICKRDIRLPPLCLKMCAQFRKCIYVHLF